MPWIETLHEDDWDGELAELKPDVIDRTHERVDWIMRVHSLDPGSLRAHHLMYLQAMKGTETLRKVEREMLALVVSKVNDCHY
jgi:alkylhydroperoxidase family enzyme